MGKLKKWWTDTRGDETLKVEYRVAKRKSYKGITERPADYYDLPYWEQKAIDKELKRVYGAGAMDRIARTGLAWTGKPPVPDPATAPAPQRVVRRSAAVVIVRRRRTR